MAVESCRAAGRRDVRHEVLPQLDRLEEDVVPGVARHLAMPPLEQSRKRAFSQRLRQARKETWLSLEPPRAGLRARPGCSKPDLALF